MTIGFRIAVAAARADDGLLDRFAEVPTAHASDCMHRMFAGGAALRPMHGGGKLVGSALTVRVRPGDNLMVHKAIDIARPRDVIVVDAGGDLTQAIVGELMMRHAQKRLVAGFVIHGAVRDSATIRSDSFPVYALGVTHRGPYKDGPGEINAPVAIGGMVVSPGDVIVGDEDGVVAVPLAQAEQVLALAAKHREREDRVMRDILAGTVDRSWVDAALEARGLGR
ncbi:MAG: RraA family protein [Burkholderiales bacterium]|nr:RraA family protein [Burkholderiales bacterium]MCE7876138.1 RraA family protein [Betaproteobacteria bacterium PRO3]